MGRGLHRTDHRRLQGKTKGVLTYREGKIIRLLEWLDQEGEDLEVEMTLAGLCSRNAKQPDKR